MPTIPPTISPAPDAPQRGDRTTFSVRVDAFLTWLIAAVTQFAAVATNAYNNAVEAVNAAIAAGDAAGSAATSAGESAASAEAAAEHLASLPAGSINDGLTDSTHTYSSNKLVATFGRLASANTWTAAQTFQSSLTEPPVVASVSGNYALPDRSLHDLTVTANTTFEFPVAANGKAFTVWLKQGGVGGWTYAFPANVRPANGTTYIPTAAAGKTDTLTFAYDGAYWLMYVGAQNATRA